ncbi:hypothetical protein PVK06_030533 [Gossypium arboreum]|uniref:Uncharacterized protein n=1 Tax=Gossypium arboreum TaxID=29729 RepID=A0ABR0NNJ4_GOSAR|nr:hypothetical protein PVK06_030533 [Gossypium arboreum]
MDYKKVWEPFLLKGIPKTSSKVKKVHELNQGEQEEPSELDTEESTNETGTEANSVTNTKEEFDKELNSPKPVEGSTNPKPKVKPEEETIKISVEPESTTPMLASTNAILETWTEDTDYASRDGAGKDKGNEKRGILVLLFI